MLRKRCSDSLRLAPTTSRSTHTASNRNGHRRAPNRPRLDGIQDSGKSELLRFPFFLPANNSFASQKLRLNPQPRAVGCQGRICLDRHIFAIGKALRITEGIKRFRLQGHLHALPRFQFHGHISLAPKRSFANPSDRTGLGDAQARHPGLAFVTISA